MAGLALEGPLEGLQEVWGVLAAALALAARAQSWECVVRKTRKRPNPGLSQEAEHRCYCGA